MTNKEAIARLKEFAKDNCFRRCGCAINVEWCDFCNDREMFNKAIEALEKKMRKPQPETDLSGKCGSCRYLDYADKCSVGYKCTNEIMNKKRKRRIASYKIRTTKACKRYEEAE